MAKYYGKIGYAEQNVQTAPGVFVDQVVEYPAYGDVIRNVRNLQEGGNLNRDITVNNSISIMMDAYSRNHFFAIRYLEWAGTLWTVSEVTVESPRLILRLGGVYNGPRPAP